MKTPLYDEVLNLPEIPPSASDAYSEHLSQMVASVNKQMKARPDIGMLTGDSPVSVMFDNHKNHALFMSGVFSLNRFDMLVHTVPWVYYTYHQRGFSYSYFPAHLNAWKAAINNFLTPEEGQPILQVYDWILDRHETFIFLSKKWVHTDHVPDAKWQAVYEQFRQALVDGDRSAALEMARQSTSSFSQLNDFCIEVIQPAMYKIGALWENGQISVAREHLASAIVNRVMAVRYIELIKTQGKSRGRVIVTTAANEFHEIGATIIANSLEADDWEVNYLGANTPHDALLEFISTTNPDIVAISSTMPFSLTTVRDIIREIRSWSPDKQPMIITGGLAFKNAPGLAKQMGADGYAEDARKAVLLANQWVEEKRRDDF